MPRMLGDEAGAVGVILAVSLSAIIGFAALGSVASLWYIAKRGMQGAADAAAFSGATALEYGATTSRPQAVAVAAANGFANGADGVTVTVNQPPSSGAYTSNNQAVEVIVQQPQNRYLASLFLGTDPVVAARAVAVAGAVGTGCVLALDHSDVVDLASNGNTTVNLNGCSLYINSPSSNALSLNGQATINAYSAGIVGSYATSGQGALNTTNGTNTGISPVADPYQDVPMPSPGACTQTNLSLKSGTTQELTPGTYCGGISVSGGSTLTLDPGTYVINGGSFAVSGNSTVSGNGVTLVLTGSGGNYATVSIAGGSVINLTAPPAGSTSGIPGIAFFQDRNAPAGTTDSFTGGATQNITGAIYLPSAAVTFNGGTSTGGATCTQLVARTITFNGNAGFNTNCNGAGTRAIGAVATTLVE